MAKKTFLKIIVFCFGLGLISVIAIFVLKPAVFEIRSLTTPSPEAEKPIKLVFTGDIMLDRGVEYQIQKQGENDWRFPFLKIADKLNAADLVIGNLESQISDKGENQGSIYSFRADPQAIEGLKFAGFDIVSLANNHSFDYGKEALKDSLSRLISTNISPIGAGNENQAYAPVIKTIDNTRIAFFAYAEGPETWKATENNIGIALVSDKTRDRIKTDISLAKDLSDLVIVSFHWGEEYAKEPSQFQKDLAKAVIDAGADLVIGSHAHVVQESEIYNGHHIFYSLGNFVFDQGFSEETLEGEIVEIAIENKKIKQVFPKRIKINEFFQPEPAL